MYEISMGDAILRAARPDDASPLSELAIRTYTDAFGHSMSASDLHAHVRSTLLPENFRRILKQDTVLVAEVGEQLVGFIQFGRSSSEGTNESVDGDLHRLYVHEGIQNQGIGTQLMTQALGHPNFSNVTRIFLDVWEHNGNARRFYERFGFRVIGERRFEVESGAPTSLDLILMRERPD